MISQSRRRDKAGQAGHVHTRLRLPGTHQHASVFARKGKHDPACEILWPRFWIHSRKNSGGAICGGNARAYASASFNETVKAVPKTRVVGGLGSQMKLAQRLPSMARRSGHEHGGP